jgi:DNA-directed RNA polymerase subunit M/transcription elongation factor TFIIS
MLTLKGCPRCKGDLHSNRDMYGSYRECLQCGYMQDIVEPNKLSALLASGIVKKKVA